jgi:hypothetical protein
MEGINVTFETPFPDVLVAKVGEAQIIRSGFLGSLEKLNHIISYARSDRIAFVQYNAEEEAWRKIVREHQRLSNIERPHVHLSLPIQPALYPKPPREATYHEKEIADILPKLLNMEAWAIYSNWLDELFEAALEQFNFDAIDEYTLEAHLEDFRHEVNSDLLLKNLTAIREIDHQKSAPTLEEEKQLIRLRQELRRMIEAHYSILKVIIARIQEIETEHPELQNVGNLSMLLKNIIQNQLKPFDEATLKWGLQEISLQLLDDALGVQPILNCSHDHGRTIFAMVLRITIMQMKESHSLRELILMIETWSKESVTPIIQKFKDNVFENYKNIYQVWTKHSHDATLSDLVLNLEYMHYLPLEGRKLIYT